MPVKKLVSFRSLIFPTAILKKVEFFMIKGRFSVWKAFPGPYAQFLYRIRNSTNEIENLSSFWSAVSFLLAVFWRVSHICALCSLCFTLMVFRKKDTILKNLSFAIGEIPSVRACWTRKQILWGAAGQRKRSGQKLKLFIVQKIIPFIRLITYSVARSSKLGLPRRSIFWMKSIINMAQVTHSFSKGLRIK